MIIDGKAIALKKYDELKDKVSKLSKKPTLLAILVGNNPSSLRYIRQKKKWAEYVGINFSLDHIDENIEEKILLEKIEKYNNDKSITGIMVQLPLPKQIDPKKVINLINPLKDVDGFNEYNQGKVLIGDNNGLIPCTPLGVMDILEDLKVDLSGKNITVIGKSNIVGKPLIMLLVNSGATVTSCNSKTKNIDYYTKNSDIIILAVGKPGLLNLSMINNKSIIIDVGFTVVDDVIYGDAMFEEINNNGNLITPVPGGVGPLTVANLMINVVKSYHLINN